jgi:hypothetical protein
MASRRRIGTRLEKVVGEASVVSVPTRQNTCYGRLDIPIKALRRSPSDVSRWGKWEHKAGSKKICLSQSKSIEYKEKPKLIIYEYSTVLRNHDSVTRRILREACVMSRARLVNFPTISNIDSRIPVSEPSR